MHRGGADRPLIMLIAFLLSMPVWIDSISPDTDRAITEGWRVIPEDLDVFVLQIVSTEQFLKLARTYGWEGTGSEGDPVLIENMQFRYSGDWAGEILLLNSIDLNIGIRNCTFDAWTEEYYSGFFLSISECRGVEIIDCYFEGNIRGILISSCGNISVRDSQIHMQRADRYYFDHAVNIMNCDDVLIRNLLLEGIETRGDNTGISVAKCDQVKIDSCFLKGLPEAIYVEDILYIEVTGNNITDCGTGIHFSHCIGKISDNELKDLSRYFEHHPTDSFSGILLEDCNSCWIEGNRMDGLTGGIYVYRSSGTLIEDNIISRATNGMVTASSHATKILKNSIYGKGKYGTGIELTQEGVISGCTIDGFYTGMEIGSLNGAILTNNLIDASVGTGLYIHYSKNVLFRDNVISGGRNGIYIEGYYMDRSNNTFLGNQVLGSTEASVFFDHYGARYASFLDNQFDGPGFVFTTYIEYQSQEWYTMKLVGNTLNGKEIKLITDVDMYGATVQGGFGQLFLHNVTNARFEGTHISGPNLAILMDSTDMVTFDNINLSQIGDKGIYNVRSGNLTVINSSFSQIENIALEFRSSGNITIRNSSFIECNEEILGHTLDGSDVSGCSFARSEEGVRIYSTKEVSIRDDRFEPAGLYQITLGNNKDVLIDNNTFTRGGIELDNYGEIEEFENIDITMNNTIDGVPIYYGVNKVMGGGELEGNFSQIILRYCSGFKITDQSMVAVDIAVDLAHCDRIKVENNSIKDCNTCLRGLYLDNSTFVNNTIIECKAGIYISNSQDINITENRIEAARDLINSYIYGSGMYISGCEDLNISQNVINDTSSYGFYVGNCKTIIISDNSISNISKSGVMLYGTTSDSIFSDNRIDNCGEYGIYTNYYFTTDTLFNVISGNQIGKCGNGGVYASSSNALYYSNHFFNSSFTIHLDIDPEVPDKDHHIHANNTVNGFPVIYYHDINMTGVSLPPDIGQLILVGVESADIPGLAISGCSEGVIICESQQVTLTGAVIEECTGSGITIFDSDVITVKVSTIQGCDLGIRDVFTTSIIRDNILEDNRIGLNVLGGTDFRNPFEIEIVSNTFKTNMEGIHIGDPEDPYDSHSGLQTNIAFNNFTGNFLGINISSDQDGEVINNIFFRNTGPAILNLYGHYSFRFWENAFLFNNGTNSEYDPNHPQVEDRVSSNNSQAWCNYQRAYGNYWSDLTGPDKDWDGIVDGPYVIRTLRDRYGYEYMTLDPFPLSGPYPFQRYANITAFGGKTQIRINIEFRFFQTDVTVVRIYKGKDPGNMYLLHSVHGMTGSTLSYEDRDIMEFQTYYYQAEIEWEDDSVSWTGIVNATLDRMLPRIIVSEPGPVTYMRDRNITVRWDVIDEGSGPDHSTVNIYGPGRYIRDREFENNEFQIIEMEDGNYNIDIFAKDRAGNDNEVTLEIIVDNIRPWIDEKNLTVTTEAWNRSVNVKYGAYDDRSGIDLVEFYVDDVLWLSTTGHTKEVWLDDTDLQGRNLSIRVTDRAGNSNETTIVMELDQTAPEFEFVYPPDGSYINTNSIEIRWQYDTSITDLDAFMIRLDEGLWINAGAKKSHFFTVDEERTYNVTLRAYDTCGNMRTKTVMFTIDRTYPTVELLSPLEGSSDVPLDALILFRFSEPVDPTTVHATMTYVQGTLSMENGTFIFAPVEKLRPNVRYELRINGADLAGNWMLERKFYFQAQGYGKLEGVVINPNGRPIENAFISIDGEVTLSTDGYGAFSIRLPEGTYNVTIEHPDYETWSKDVFVQWGATNDLGYIILTSIDGENHGGEDDDDDTNKWLISGIITIVLSLVLIFLLIYMIGLIRRDRDRKGPFEE